MTDTSYFTPLAPEAARHVELLQVLYSILSEMQKARTSLTATRGEPDQERTEQNAEVLTVLSAIEALSHPEIVLPPYPPFPSAREIAEALRSLPLPSTPDLSTPLEKITDKLTALSRQITAGVLSPSGSSLALDNILRDIKNKVSDSETRIDYDTRTDSNPVYLGRAENGTAISSHSWSIKRMTYDSSSRITRVEVLTGAWTNRTTLSWTT